MIYARTTSSGYGDGSGGDGGGGSAAASGSYSAGSAYMRSGGGAGGSGGAGSSQGTGRGTLYQDYGDSSYGYCEPVSASNVHVQYIVYSVYIVMLRCHVVL